MMIGERIIRIYSVNHENQEVILVDTDQGTYSLVIGGFYAVPPDAAFLLDLRPWWKRMIGKKFEFEVKAPQHICRRIVEVWTDGEWVHYVLENDYVLTTGMTWVDCYEGPKFGISLEHKSDLAAGCFSKSIQP